MVGSFIEIRKSTMRGTLLKYGIQPKYHNKLCDIIKEEIVKRVPFVIEIVAREFIQQNYNNSKIREKLNPQRKLK